MSRFGAEKADREYWDLVITHDLGKPKLNISELLIYRDLSFLFFRRDFVAFYKQTILGPLWYILQPFLTTIVFTIVFGNIANLSTDSAPPFLFYLAGNTLWSFFSNSTTSISNTFIDNAQLFGKIYFPRLILPISMLFSNLLSFSIRFLFFLIFVIYYLISGANVQVTIYALLLPLLLLIIASISFGAGLLITSLTTKYRDLRHLVAFGIQLLLYGTPIIYPLSTAEGFLRALILANPLTAVFEVFRLGFLGTSTISPLLLLPSSVFAFVLLVIGLNNFVRVESTFMDTI